MSAVEETRAGPVVRVKVKPRARRDALVAVEAEVVRIEVRAAPEDGKANAAVRTVLARALGVPVRDIELVSGGAVRDKRLLVRGLTPAEVRARLS